MAEIIPLNRIRKAKAKAARTAQADANRAKFGRTKAGKDADRIEAERRTALLDGALRED